MQYDHKSVEKKWQKRWEEEGVFRVADNVKVKNKRYILDMFPYPSGAGLHVGHPEGYTATDIYARYSRMKGFSVLHPMGWDAFGLPAENYAIKSGVHPDESTRKNIATFTRQIKALGFSYDWSREVNTSAPEYYKWTQWLFLQLYKAGLAYKKAAPVNWCPSCQTVLANEQVVDGKCERCHSVVELKNLEQWFFKIIGAGKNGSYPERLLENLEKLDWPEPIKTMQKNWIGRSEGAEIEFRVEGVLNRHPKRSDSGVEGSSGFNTETLRQAQGDVSIKVFTTRPDTIFGATFMAISPELAQKWIEVGWQASAEVKKYVKKALAERTKNDKAAEPKKTGVFSGIYAVNPANQEKIPVWVADYVLAGYGTGAIMAVPAHDERDYEFAKKYDLPIKQVIALETGVKRSNEERRDGGGAVVFDPKTQKYAVAKQDNGLYRLYSGGIDDGEAEQAGILREVEEESGLRDFSQVEKITTSFSHYYNSLRKVNRVAKAVCYLVVLGSAKTHPPKLEAHEKFVLTWASADEILKNWTERNQEKDYDHWIWFLQQSVGRAIELGHDKISNPKIFYQSSLPGDGVMINSGGFDGMDSKEAKIKIIEKVGGKKTIQYKLRDWLISRQRYWGAPIPIIYCDDCGEQAVLEKDLPVELPTDVDFRPTGESPLARSESFHKVKCPKCGKAARRESDTMDTFVDSSWYWLRYTDPNNDKEFAAKEKINAWLPVDTYVGGAEHAVLHLMYARFITMALCDLGFIEFEEPFLQLRNQGLILGPDGQKMSKSRGNVINPDEVVEKFGADTMRMYEMFMGPLEDSKPWDTNGMVGVRRFLDRVWEMQKLQMSKSKIQTNVKIQNPKNTVERELHKLIKKVGSDIESFDFNTAVSQFMIFVNTVFKQGEISQEHLELFLRVLAPFAPHLANELWEKLGHKELIEKEAWPKYDESLLVEDEVVYIVQVNGKLRAQISAAPDASEQAIVDLVKSDEKVSKYLEGAQIVKQIFVPAKLINFVTK